MTVSRALLAFQALERDPRDPNIYSDDADLGADMKGAAYQAVLDIRDWLYAYQRARSEAESRAQAEAKARVLG